MIPPYLRVLKGTRSRLVLKIDKKAAYQAGYCAHCAGFFNYKVANTVRDLDEIRTKIKKSGPPRFLCGLTLPAGKKHLCTAAYKYPSTLKGWKKEHVMIPGKFIEMVEDSFIEKVAGQG